MNLGKTREHPFRFFTNSGSRRDISAIVRRHSRAGERENGQIVQRSAARGWIDFPIRSNARASVVTDGEAFTTNLAGLGRLRRWASPEFPDTTLSIL